MHLLKIHKCIFSVLEGWESAIRMPAWLGSAESPQLGYRLTSCWVLMWQKEDKRALGSPFQECSHSLIKIPLSWPYQLTKAPSTNTLTLRVRISTCRFERREHTHLFYKNGHSFIYSTKFYWSSTICWVLFYCVKRGIWASELSRYPQVFSWRSRFWSTESNWAGYFLLGLKGTCLDFSNSFSFFQFTSQKTEEQSSRVKGRGKSSSLLI